MPGGKDRSTPKPTTMEREKRKASPFDFGSSPPLKRQASLPDLFEKNTVTATEVSLAIEESIINTISKKSVIELLAKAISVHLKDSQTELEKKVISSLDAIKAENKRLHELLMAKQNVIDSQTKRIEELNNKVIKLNDDMASLNTTLEKEVDKLEQYGRRNALRLRRVRITDVPKSRNDQGQEYYDTDKFVKTFCMEKLEVDIPESAIGRSHLLGPPRDNGICSIIVKFATYNFRQLVYASRFKLKGRSQCLITEDLTKYRQSLVQRLISLKTQQRIARFWTKDGRVFFKSSEQSRVTEVDRLEDLNHCG